jgi:quinoprotein dehydrogenase-associated probable ABC transporter substrate-binding protein
MKTMRKSQFAALLTAAVFGLSGQAAALPQEAPAASVELIDPKVFRVCSDPRNLPFSNEKSEGFENKLAELLAAKLGKSLAYTWYPNSMGFVRNTLGSYKCDVIMGFPQGDDIAQITNPYYATSYALVYKPGTGLDGAASLADPRLKDKRLGIVAGTPPSNAMLANGLMTRAKPYPLVIDTRVDSSARDMIRDIEDGTVDAGVLWGPMAGYFAQHSEPKLAIAPLEGPRMSFMIGMAVRHSDQEFKRLLNRLIQENQAEIDALLASYGVPLLDAQNRPLAASAAQKSSATATPRN